MNDNEDEKIIDELLTTIKSVTRKIHKSCCEKSYDELFKLYCTRASFYFKLSGYRKGGLIYALTDFQVALTLQQEFHQKFWVIIDAMFNMLTVLDLLNWSKDFDALCFVIKDTAERYSSKIDERSLEAFAKRYQKVTSARLSKSNMSDEQVSKEVDKQLLALGIGKDCKFANYNNTRENLILGILHKEYKGVLTMAEKTKREVIDASDQRFSKHCNKYVKVKKGFCQRERKTVAIKNIQNGTVIISEKPIVGCYIGNDTTVFHGDSKYVCHNCGNFAKFKLKGCKNCEDDFCSNRCIAVMAKKLGTTNCNFDEKIHYETKKCNGCGHKFCSEKCYNEAWASYHKFECKIFGEHITHLITMTDKDVNIHATGLLFIKFFGKFVDESMSSGGGDVSDLFDLSSLSLMKIEDYSMLEFFNPDDFTLRQICIGGDTLYRYFVNFMTFITYGRNSVKFPFFDFPTFMKFVNLINRNFIVFDKNRGFLLDSITFINHSCKPNSILEFENGIVKVRTVKKIKSGEEITISYEMNSDVMSYIQRAVSLQRFGFMCKCKKCTKQAPIEFSKNDKEKKMKK